VPGKNFADWHQYGTKHKKGLRAKSSEALVFLVDRTGIEPVTP
jgi:hypothetical protein